MSKTKPRISKARFDRLIAPIRDHLLDAQFDLLKARAAGLAVIITGVPTAGRSESISDLLEWLDPKFIRVHAYGRKAAHTRPPLWPYWQDLPAKGQIGLFFGAWYEEWVYGACRRKAPRPADERRAAARIRQLEAMLVRDNVHLLKIHLDLPADMQRKRLRKLGARALTRWRVTREDRWLVNHARRLDAVFSRCLKATATPAAPWHRVDGKDEEHRSLTLGRLVLAALGKATKVRPERAARTEPARTAKTTPLQVAVADPSLTEAEYEQELLELQGRLARLSRKRRFLERGAVFVFEGMDAAGKGGAIRRLVHALDPRQYQIVPISAPGAEERLYPYLWRFWRQIPDRGHITVFDRSWYGRVLVERVRGFAEVADWQRAYEEIKEFEAGLVEHGIILCKFWLDVSSRIQLERFRERDSDSLKRFKVDPEDWVNRRHFAAYQVAASDMVRRTHTRHAPWTLVDANDKQQARVQVLRSTSIAIEQALD